jgi:hypothetical protein
VISGCISYICDGSLMMWVVVAIMCDFHSRRATRSSGTCSRCFRYWVHTFRALLYQHVHYLSRGLFKQRDRLRVIWNFLGSGVECVRTQSYVAVCEFLCRMRYENVRIMLPLQFNIQIAYVCKSVLLSIKQVWLEW